MFRSSISSASASACAVPVRVIGAIVRRNSQLAISLAGASRLVLRRRAVEMSRYAAPSALTSVHRYCSNSSGNSSGCLAAHGVSIASLCTALDSNSTTEECTGGVVGREVTVRARVERVRGRGKVAFLHLRQPPLESLQAVCIGKELATQAKAVTPESIVDVTGVVQRATSPVTSTTCQSVELHVSSLRVVSPAATPLPFPYRDANTKLDTRLNHRVMDLRTERMVAITRLVSALGEAFRSELLKRQFIEVHTPKLIAAASEGGSNVFTVDYFGKPAYLAQSPQLYKQMLLMGDAMRVFEIGPVFRAENSLTHRHLTEFVGLDGEMVIEGSYTEVLDVLEPVMCAMLKTLTTTQAPLIHALWRQQQECDSQGKASAAAESSESKGSAEATGNHQGEMDSAVSGQGHALRDVCCEVPESVIASLGLTSDVDSATMAAGAPDAHPVNASSSAETSRDPYHARIGGVSACRVLRLAFADAAQLLVDEGRGDGSEDDVMAGCALPLTDFTLPQERRLGKLIKARYGVDLYVIDLFPAEARPFYTMPLDATQPEGPTRSYDMYLRGEEICSGAQRIDNVELLEQRLAAKKVDRATVKDYIDAFRYGAWPHGGFGLGLERIALFFLGLDDIRHVSLFPRDPKRITP